MITNILAIGAVALKWVGGGAGVLGAISALVRIPFVSGLVSAVPVIGPLITEAAKVILGWLDTAVRFLARACLALLEEVSGRPLIAVPILLALWGQQLYFEHWKYRGGPAPAAASAPPQSSWRLNFRRWLANRIAPPEALPTELPYRVGLETSPATPEGEPVRRTRRAAARPSKQNDPFDWIERNFRF